MNRVLLSRLFLGALFVASAVVFGQSMSALANPTLADLWSGRAHFVQVGEIGFSGNQPGVPAETATWYAVKDGRWYAFSRVIVEPAPPGCPSEHRQVVVRESLDKGRTWSPPTVAVAPGSSPAGDGCAVLDGDSYFDADLRTWHLLTQCLDRGEVGGWGLCHYSRHAETPMGRFVGDSRNPVVRGGRLWRRICGADKACPIGVIDEGTPDIVGRQKGLFIVTMHGYQPRSGQGYRGVFATPDFRSWQTQGIGLPGDAILSRRDCKAWFSACVGFGEGSSIISDGRIYTLIETMDRGLACQKDQKWVFALYRSKTLTWPGSGSSDWEVSPQKPFLRGKWRDRTTPCGLAYAHLIEDEGNIYLTYEDWEAHYGRLHRRLLKLVAGTGPLVQIR